MKEEFEMIPFPAFYLALLCCIVLLLVSLRATEKRQKMLLLFISTLQSVLLLISWPLWSFSSARILEPYLFATGMILPVVGLVALLFQFLIKGHSRRIAVVSIFLQLLGGGLAVLYAAETIAVGHC